MAPKPEILDYLAGRADATGRELRQHLGISRQALNVHLRRLIDSGEVVKIGSTRGARYSLASRAPAPAVAARVLTLEGLDEGSLYDELATVLNLSRELPRHVEAIVHYAFTEIVNNAVEHSESRDCRVSLSLATATVSFSVRDRGIGVFHSIASKLKLEDEQTAMVELFKGKTTTMPAAHTGEGIFFTSRAADRFELRSHRIQVEWSRARDDVFASRRRFIAGTEARFQVQRTTRRRLEDVFEEFAPAAYDFQFQRTRVYVKLIRRDYVSRSEAKRLLANLERFREIVLDFRDVESIGQGFADEVFRVFARRHPEIAIRTEKTNPVIDAMLRHVRQG